MNFKPLGKRILLKRNDVEEKTTSGLYIPDSAQSQENKGVVCAIGNVETINVGDTVLFEKYAGQDISIDDNTYLILKEDDILGVMGE